MTKFGEKGVINLGKMVPVVGGLIGASVDTISTRAIGRIAKKTFTNNGLDIGNGVIIESNKILDSSFEW